MNKFVMLLGLLAVCILIGTAVAYPNYPSWGWMNSYGFTPYNYYGYYQNTWNNLNYRKAGRRPLPFKGGDECRTYCI